MQGRVAREPLPCLNAEIRHRPLDEMSDVGVRDYYALRIAGGPGRKHNVRRVLFRSVATAGVRVHALHILQGKSSLETWRGPALKPANLNARMKLWLPHQLAKRLPPGSSREDAAGLTRAYSLRQAGGGRARVER